MGSEDNRRIYGALAWLIKAMLTVMANAQWNTRISSGELGHLRRAGEDHLRNINGYY